MTHTAANGSSAESRRATRSTGARAASMRLVALALVAGLTLTLAACSSSSPSSSPSTTTRPSSTAATVSPAWARIDRGLSALGPRVGFLAARVSAQGTCQPIHEVASSTPRPTASQFKLFVLGALANQIARGQISWNQTLTVRDAVKSLGNGPGTGALQFAAQGAKISVERTATKMISISDNTAADMLIGLVGRGPVEAQVRQWSAHPSANYPFLTTKEMLLLHYAKGLAARYLATPRAERAAFLTSSVDTLPVGAIATGYSSDPRYIDDIEWFASPADLCRAFAGLQQLSKKRALVPLSKVLSRAVFGIGLDRSAWPTVWFKGGSESGVLTVGWLVTNSQGQTFVVEAMVSNPDAALSADSIPKLVALARSAFGLLG